MKTLRTTVTIGKTIDTFDSSEVTLRTNVLVTLAMAKVDQSIRTRMDAALREECTGSFRLQEGDVTIEVEDSPQFDPCI